MAIFVSNPDGDGLPRTSDVVIIGGGPAGAAALWALNRLSPGLDITLVEKNGQLASGSSLASLECFRSCWPAVCLARQMQRSVEVFRNADHYLGEGAAESIHVRQRGYLFCALTERQSDGLRADVKRLHEIGLRHIAYLDTDEVQYRYGWLGPKVIAGKFDPMAGWLDSNALVNRYVASAPSARVVLNVKDVQICVEGGRVTGINTPHGPIATPSVVIAAGADANSVVQSAGISLPIIMRPRQSFTTGWRHAAFPADSPMVIAAAPHPHVHPEAQSGAIFGWEYGWHNKHAEVKYRSEDACDALRTPVYPVEGLKDRRFPSAALTLLARQFGHAEGEGFADGRYLRSVRHNIGYYVYRDGSTAFRTNADGTQHPYDSERAIIDAYPGVDGLFLSVAHVGHGIMTSPAAGEILANKVLGRSLPDPAFADFGLGVPWVEYDEGVL